MAKKFSPQKLAERVLRLAQERGSDAKEVRDAAHEASHAMELGLTDWSREAIHEALTKLPRADQFRSEMLARAVEANICALCKLEYDQDLYLLLAGIEGAKGGIIFPPDFKAHVERARGSLEVWSIVTRLRKLRLKKRTP